MLEPRRRRRPSRSSAPTSLLDAERALILDALRRSSWNVTQAARLLNISRDTMRYRIEKHRLQPGA